MKEQVRTLTRREFLRLTAVTATGALVAACGPAPATQAPATPAQPEAATEVPPTPTQAEVATQAPAAEKVAVRWQDWPDWEPDIDKLMALFEEKLPNIKVEFEPLTDDFEDKTLTQMVAGNAPDVMTGWGAVFRKWAEKGQLLDLQPLVDMTYSAEQLKDFHPWQWAGMVAPDTRIRFAMPYYVNVIMLLYNVDAFDEAGVPYPTADTDHTGYAEILKKMTKKEGDKVVRWGGYVQAWSYDRFQFHVQAYGGHVVSPEDWTECTLDRPEAQEALEWLRARIWDDNSAAQPLQVEQRGEGQIWPTGLVATSEGGMGNLAFYADEAKFKWALTHIPKGTVRRSTLGTNDGWAIYKATKHPNEAWEFMKVLVGDDFQTMITSSWGGIPNRLSLLANWKTLTIKRFPVLEHANLDAVLQALQEGYPMMMEEFKKQAESSTLVNAALEKVFQVGDTPVTYFQEVAQEVTKVNREE
jgi:multiple sugar transport system substrate-binding protein